MAAITVVDAALKTIQRIRSDGTSFFRNSVIAATVFGVAITLGRAKSSPETRKSIKDGRVVKSIPHLFSWIPWIGAGIQLQAGLVRDFILNSAARLGDTPVFTATIMGDRCLFIADPMYLPFLFRETPTLDGLTLQKKFIHKVMGFSLLETMAMFTEAIDTQKSIMQLFHEYLLKDGSLRTLTRDAQHLMDLQLQQLTPETLQPDQAASNWSRHSLFDFVSAVVFAGGAGSLLSPELNKNSKEHLANLRALEKDMALLLVGAPPSLMSSCIRARDALEALFDSDEIRASESLFLKQRRAAISAGYGENSTLRPIVDSGVARGNVGVFLVVLSNSINSMFWTLLHLVRNDDAWRACRQSVLEIAERREPGRSWFTLEELDEMILLQSAFMESLRLYQMLFVTRQAVTDFELKPTTRGSDIAADAPPRYLVKKGTLILAFPNVMHMDSKLFPDPESFQYDRFVDKTSHPVKLVKSSIQQHLRPFGGGFHICPGRKFASYEARALLAMLLLNYDVRLVDELQKVPDIDMKRQGASVAIPCRDVEFELRTRT